MLPWKFYTSYSDLPVNNKMFAACSKDKKQISVSFYKPGWQKLNVQCSNSSKIIKNPPNLILLKRTQTS